MSTNNMNNIIVKMGMANKNSKRFNVSKNMTVGAFKTMITDTEGVQGVELVYMAKKLSNDNATLSSVGCHNNCTMFCSKKMLDGTTNHNINQARPLASKTTEAKSASKDEPEGGCHVFNEKLVKKFGDIVVTTDCVINASDGCQSKEIKKAKLPCGCIFCPDCMRLRVRICARNSYRIRCAGFRGHNKDIPLEMAFAIAGYGEKEADKFQSKLTEYWMNTFMRQCPNEKCGSFLFNGADLGKVNRVMCPVCKAYDYCWFCQQKWILGGSRICGNANCDPVANFTAVLYECQPKTISGYGETIEDVPAIRLCTNKKCSVPNEHVKAGKHITCKTCGKEYCHSCLKDWGRCSLRIKCVPADVQEVTIDMIQDD